MAKLGFVGLGVMGGGIANRLLAAGHEVAGYNRTREKARWLVERGVQLKDTPREVAEAADVVFSMVTNTAALKAVTEGPDGILAGLGARKTYIGKLSIMVGGDEEAFERVRPILLDIGPVVKRIGGNGQALLLKLAINLSLHVQMVAFSEGLLLAEKDGIDKEVAVEAMLSSVIASPMLQYRGPFVLEQPEEAWFDCNMMQKDMNLALEAGREHDVPMPTTAVSNELLTTARAMGLGHHDFAIVYEVLARMAGREKVER